MSKDSFEDKYNDYDEGASPIDYDAYDMEESVRMSRRARREAREKRKSKKAGSSKNFTPPQPETAPEEERTKISLPPVDEPEEVREDMSRKSSGRKKSKKDKKPKTAKQKFFRVLGTIVAVYLVIIAAFLGYTYMNIDTQDGEPLPKPKEVIDQITQDVADIATGTVPDRTTFFIMVTDEDKTRTDSMIMGNYDNVNGRLTLITIPRDTIVSVSAVTYDIMRSEYPEPGRRIMKLTEVHHFGGENHGIELLLSELERIYGFKPDYYIRLDFEAFNYLVDSIGGIDYDVPRVMKYDDPTQDLHIDLQPGFQHLNGEQVQHLVRYRKDNYGNDVPGGDLTRIKIQQDVIKLIMEKALATETILKNPTAYVTAFFKYVKTNVTVIDAVKYIKVAKNFDTNQIYTYTMPGDVAYIDGISGYEVYDDDARKLMYDVFEKPLTDITREIEEEKKIDEMGKTTDKTIIVLNGGYRNGRAAEIQQFLETKGYTVNDIGSFEGTKPEGIKIYTAEEGVGKDLSLVLENSEIIVDSSITAQYGHDIVIVVGIEEEEN